MNPAPKRTCAEVSGASPAPLCPFFLLFCWTLLFASFLRPLLDPDLWTHLKTGEYISLHGLPAADVFSYTVLGRPWLNHEWLSQVFLWKCSQPGGLDFLILVPAIFSVITLGFIYKSCEGSRRFALYVTLLVSAIFYSAAIYARPYLFTFLFTAVYVYVLEKVKSRRLDSRWFLLFPILTLFWVNLHGAYVAGLGILVLYAFGDWLGWHLKLGSERNLGQEGLRRLVLSIFLCILASLANPFGFHSLIYPFFSAAGHAHLNFISEWQSPNFHKMMAWPFLLAFSGGLLVCAADRKKPDLTELIVFLATGFASFYSIRHMPFFAIVSAPVIARHGLSVLKDTRWGASFCAGTLPEPWTFRRSLTTVFFLSFAIAATLVWAAVLMKHNGRAIEKEYPVAAVDHIKKTGLDRQRIYNDYDWGGYLIWRGIPVFMDGRGEVYEKSLIESYMKTLKAKRNWRETLNDGDVQYLLLKRNRALASVLDEAADWKQVYQDPGAVIFVKEKDRSAKDRVPLEGQ